MSGDHLFIILLYLFTLALTIFIFLVIPNRSTNKLFKQLEEERKRKVESEELLRKRMQEALRKQKEAESKD